MCMWSYSTLYRSVHCYNTLFLKHGGKISVEVIGRRRKTKRIERIFRCVDSVSVGIYNELLTVKLYYCHRILVGLLRISVWSRVDICSFCRVYYTFGLLDCVRYIEDSLYRVQKISFAYKFQVTAFLFLYPLCVIFVFTCGARDFNIKPITLKNSNLDIGSYVFLSIYAG